MFYDNNGLVVAATYARVSTRAQEEGISLDQQERAMLEYAARQKIQVPAEYRFREAASGLKDEREEYAKIRQLIKERKINALIVYSTDRHTRDPIHGKIFRAELRRAKATLHIVTKGGLVDILSAQGELMATVEDAFNRYWLDKILEVTYEKKQEYLKEGIPFVQGHVRYGYKRVGKKKDAQAVIDEETAPTIRRIYNWAEEGLSPYQIEKLLRGTPAPGDLKHDKLRAREYGRWSQMAIYRILRDEIYAGIYWANREEVYEDDDGKKRKRQRPRDEWIRIPVPAIINREQWERVQHKLDTSARERPRMHTKHEYLLARRMRCGVCGYAYTTTTQSRSNGSKKMYYVCTSNTTQALVGARCGSRKLRSPETDAAVWAKMKEVITYPATFLARLQADQARQREQAHLDSGELTDLDELITQHAAELKVAAAEYVRVAARGGILAETYKQQVDTLERTIEELNRRRKRLERKLAAKVISDEEIATVQALAEWAQPRLEAADNDFQARRKLVEAFNWRFTLLWRDEQAVVIIHWRDWELEVPVNYRYGQDPRRNFRQ